MLAARREAPGVGVPAPGAEVHAPAALGAHLRPRVGVYVPAALGPSQPQC